MVISDIIPIEDLEDAFLGYEPNRTQREYSREEFLEFEQYVLRNMQSFRKNVLHAPVPSDNPVLLRERAQMLAQGQYWFDGALTMAEDWLTLAERNASYLDTPRDEHGKFPIPDQIKARIANMCASEQRLCTLVRRVRESLKQDLINGGSLLKNTGEEMRLAGAETR